MKITSFTALLTVLPVLTSAQLTFNITTALQPGQFQKYRCFTTEKLLPKLPACMKQCQIMADKTDGCAYDDFACHCVNYSRFSSIIEPCVFPPSLKNGHGTCTLAELGAVRPLVTDMCNFFNATLYASYAGCKIPLSYRETIQTIRSEKVVVVQ